MWHNICYNEQPKADIFVQFDYVTPETFATIIIRNKWYKSPYAFLQLISEMFQSTNGLKRNEKFDLTS